MNVRIYVLVSARHVRASAWGLGVRDSLLLSFSFSHSLSSLVLSFSFSLLLSFPLSLSRARAVYWCVCLHTLWHIVWDNVRLSVCVRVRVRVRVYVCACIC